MRARCERCGREVQAEPEGRYAVRLGLHYEPLVGWRRALAALGFKRFFTGCVGSDTVQVRRL